MEVLLTDAPAANGTSLLVTLSAVEVRCGGEWHTVAKGPFRVDLTALVGVELPLATLQVPAGHYDQVRFQVAEPAIVHAGIDESPLDIGTKTPSLAMSADVSTSGTTVMIIDIDGAESLSFEGEKLLFETRAKIVVRQEP